MPVGTQTQVRQVPIRKNGGLQPVRSVPNRLRVRPEKSDSTWWRAWPHRWLGPLNHRHRIDQQQERGDHAHGNRQAQQQTEGPILLVFLYLGNDQGAGDVHRVNHHQRCRRRNRGNDPRHVLVPWERAHRDRQRKPQHAQRRRFNIAQQGGQVDDRGQEQGRATDRQHAMLDRIHRAYVLHDTQVRQQTSQQDDGIPGHRLQQGLLRRVKDQLQNDDHRHRGQSNIPTEGNHADDEHDQG